MIYVNELTKVFGTFTAVDRLTFQVDDGKIFGLLGPEWSRKDNYAENAHLLNIQS